MHSVERLSTVLERGMQETNATDVATVLKEALDLWEQRGMRLLSVVPSGDDSLLIFHVDSD